jgi:hypothetical protein
LENLSKIEKRSVNQLLNVALKIFLSDRGRKESSLEANLTCLRTCRNLDPKFKRAIAAFVESEAILDDPLEGKSFEAQFIDGQLEPAGPVQSRIRKLLNT